MVIFAYTSLFIILIRESDAVLNVFKDEYFKLQANKLCITINLGLVFMLVLDYIYIKKSSIETKQMMKLIINSFISFFLILGIHFHAVNYCAKNDHRILKIFANSEFAIFMALIYLYILFWIKLKSLTNERELIIIS